MPQPYLVPVRPTCSRITHNKGVFGSTSTLCDCPLMVRATIRRLPAHPPVSVVAANSRAMFVVGVVFRKRASRLSLAASTKVGHSHFREREQCRRTRKIRTG